MYACMYIYGCITFVRVCSMVGLIVWLVSTVIYHQFHITNIQSRSRTQHTLHCVCARLSYSSSPFIVAGCCCSSTNSSAAATAETVVVVVTGHNVHVHPSAYVCVSCVCSLSIIYVTHTRRRWLFVGAATSHCAVENDQHKTNVHTMHYYAHRALSGA